MKKDTCIFISDAHFGLAVPGGEHRERHFYEFIDSVTDQMDTLVILGDFFDFWIEYSTVIRTDYFDILFKLRQLSESGVKIHYLAGNHDFALGPFLKNKMGASVYLNPLQTCIQGRKVYMYHGDGLIRADVGYRILKKILRNPFNQKLYKLLIHPDIGIQFGILCSHVSKKHNKKRYLSPERIGEYRNCARKTLRDGIHDVVFYGHTHAAELTIFPEGIYCNTGAWLSRYTYATMCNGRVKLFEYQPGKDSVELTPNVLK